MPNITYKSSYYLSILLPAKGCNFHMQVFQITLKYNCSKPIKLQKFLMQQYNLLKIPMKQLIQENAYRPMQGNLRQSFFQSIPDSRYWIPVFVSGTWIVDTNRQWDSRFLELYSGLKSPGFRTPQTKFSPIQEPTSKHCPDSRIRIPFSWVMLTSKLTRAMGITRMNM